MSKKKLQLKILDAKGETKVTHHFIFDVEDDNTLSLTIGNVEHLLDSQGNILTVPPELILVNTKGLYYVEPKYSNRETGKTQKLFDKLNPVFTVRYINPTCGDKGEALYMTVAAETPEKAIEWAMSKKEFTNHIYMKYYDKKYFEVYPATGNYVIGKVLYYEGDPRL